ncbi:MAG: ABC transporter permease [Actinobacteria bacterium]|nr:ABC transporter permease [Actinomycetota bacterium]
MNLSGADTKFRGGFGAAWGWELLKLRRSLVARLITPLLIGLVPLASIGAVALARSPELPGTAAVKFAPYATGDLAATHLLVAGQLLSVGVLLAGGFAVAWSYGREFSEGTAGAVTGLAAPRWTIGVAKALIIAVWLTASAIISLALTLLLSAAVGGQPGEEAWQNTVTATLAALLVVALVMPFACVATLTRSPLGTIGVLIAVVMLTQILVVLGAGNWFPYAVPSLLAGMGGPDAADALQPWALATTAALAPVAILTVARQWRTLNDI